MNSRNLLEYVAPTITVTWLDLEQSIAATSGATVTVGSDTNAFTPEVDDWTEQTGNQNSFL
ncbi:hypothetical protein [Sphingobacterium hungaricum]